MTYSKAMEADRYRKLRIELDGNKQDATKERNKSLMDLNTWMGHFYTIARIELKEHPQLLESLDKVVKS
ncbi:hypothetical protein [Galbibacter sp. PAP.153]|uniref:hypothetical protein n=1 Tax=Galbibacter sp. PAP.153 TaxID=3104623 RepID=UPI0030080268